MDLIFIEAQGKVQAWSRLLAGRGWQARVVACNGHVAGFPESLENLGLGFEAVGGKYRLREKARSDLPHAGELIRGAIAGLSPEARIYLATDEDTEGDVIAWDICRLILNQDRSFLSRIYRLRPRALTPTGLTQSLAAARSAIEDPDGMALAAIPGRTRAAFDRWIGHGLSRPGLPVGRIRSGLLGLLARPTQFPAETGEVILRARSARGGPPFVARIPLLGPGHPLSSLALWHAGGFIPGQVRPITTLSAAAATRIGRPAPINTAQALLTAGRQFGMNARRAADGLQAAYLAGMISYPRVDAHTISAESANSAIQIAGFAGIEGFSADLLAGPRPSERQKLQHEALHPLLGGAADLKAWRALVMLPDSGAVSDRDRMASIVARATLEAGMDRQLRKGSWDHEDEVDQDTAVLLGELEWLQEIGPRPTWSRQLDTGCRAWPTDTVLVDLLASNDLARPSTYAFHAEKLAGSDEIEIPVPYAPPRPSARGRAILEAAGDLARPGKNAALETAFARPVDPARHSLIPDAINFRLMEALLQLSDALRERLLKAVPRLPELMAPSRPAEAPKQTPPSSAQADRRVAGGQSPASAPRPSHATAPAPAQERQQEAAPSIDQDGLTTEATAERAKDPGIAPEVFPSSYQSDEPGF